MSKFEYMNFYGDDGNELAISKEKYTKDEAINIAEREFEYSGARYLAIGNGWVRHRAGIDDWGDPCVGWWLEYKEHKRSCPCWVLHMTDDKNEWCSKDYEYIDWKGERENEQTDTCKGKRHQDRLLEPGKERGAGTETGGV